jgi:hypothetical protein
VSNFHPQKLLFLESHLMKAAFNHLGGHTLFRLWGSTAAPLRMSGG